MTIQISNIDMEVKFSQVLIESQLTKTTSSDSQQNEASIILSRQNDIRTRPKRARDAQCNQAESMVKRSNIDLAYC